MKTVLFVGGGSVGHIAPSVAIARALVAMDPTIRPVFICSPRITDVPFLKAEGFDPVILDAPRLSLTFPWKFMKAYREAKKILDQHKPDVVFNKGGYVGVPLCLAAAHRKIPIVAHESDVSGGYANRIVARWASYVCLGFPSHTNDLKYVYTGNPVRSDIARGRRDEGLRITGLTGERPVLMVTGGSQGAEAINHFIYKHIDHLCDFCDVIHLTGPGKKTDLQHEGYWQQEFAYDDLKHLYAMSDLVIGRGSAGFIAEFSANHLPMILVPLRGVARDHQQQNATETEKTGACQVVQQENLSEKTIALIQSIFDAPEKMQIMQQASRSIAHLDAARQIAEVISGTLAGRSDSH